MSYFFDRLARFCSKMCVFFSKIVIFCTFFNIFNIPSGDSFFFHSLRFPEIWHPADGGHQLKNSVTAPLPAVWICWVRCYFFIDSVDLETFNRDASSYPFSSSQWFGPKLKSYNRADALAIKKNLSQTFQFLKTNHCQIIMMHLPILSPPANELVRNWKVIIARMPWL